MTFVYKFCIFLILIGSSNAQRTDSKEAELEIHNTFRPENCDRKAAATDFLTLHYTGALKDGNVFDSR